MSGGKVKDEIISICKGLHILPLVIWGGSDRGNSPPHCTANHMGSQVTVVSNCIYATMTTITTARFTKKPIAIAKKVKGTTAVKDEAKLGDGGGRVVLSVGEGPLLPDGDWPEVGGDTGLTSPEEGAGEKLGGGVGVAVGGDTGTGVVAAGAGAGVAEAAETLMVNF
ncbi:hypothetical protein LXL04_002696 [Taraxacum kok-saghyz]